MAREVADACEASAIRFEEMGCTVEEAHPHLAEAGEIFHTLRGLTFTAQMAPLLDKVRDQLKPEIVWNIEQGLALSADEMKVPLCVACP